MGSIAFTMKLRDRIGPLFPRVQLVVGVDNRNNLLDGFLLLLQDRRTFPSRTFPPRTLHGEIRVRFHTTRNKYIGRMIV